jgi:hypothetical protein
VKGAGAGCELALVGVSVTRNNDYTLQQHETYTAQFQTRTFVEFGCLLEVEWVRLVPNAVVKTGPSFSRLEEGFGANVVCLHVESRWQIKPLLSQAYTGRLAGG